MGKPKLNKPMLLDGLCGHQSTLSDTPETRLAAIKRYRGLRVLSDTPEGTTIEEFPYRIVEEGVLPHPIFKPLFDGKQPILSQDEADTLFSYDIGYDGRTKMPVRIHRNSDGTVREIVGYSPDGTAYMIDMVTTKLIPIPGEKNEL